MFIQKVSLLLKFILVQCQSICASQHALFRGLLELFFQMKHLQSLNFFLLPYVLIEITLKIRVGICQERVDFLC